MGTLSKNTPYSAGVRSIRGLTSLTLLGAFFGAVTGCTADQKPTSRCAAVVAMRQEAILTYPGASVLSREKHEGMGGNEAGEVVPWAGQTLAVRATEQAVSTWYASWLSSHGWSHSKDQSPTDSNSKVVAHLSSWVRGDETFDMGFDISAGARARFPVSDDQLLFDTGYAASASVLGCD